MKKLRSLTIMSALVVTMALTFSSCGTNKAAIAQLDELDQKIAALEQETQAVKNECARLKDVIADDNMQIERLKNRR